VTLRGAFGSVNATLDGSPVPVHATADGIELDLSLNGSHELVVSP
jgi:hypothetical protein